LGARLYRRAVHYRHSGGYFAGLFLILVAFSSGQTGRAQNAGATLQSTGSQSDLDYRLAGTVVNSVTGEPISRAAVQIYGGANHTALTDSGGHFEFGSLAKGRVFIRLKKPGFFDDRVGLYGQSIFQVGPQTSSVVLRMAPAGVIAGHVTNQDGEPLEGFGVRAVSGQNLNGRKMWNAVRGQASTDENGDFRIYGLPADTYYLAVGQSQEATLAQIGIPNAREQTYAQVFYPGVSNQSAAAPIELHAGEKVEADFELTAEPLYQVAGIVSGPENPMFGLAFARQAGGDHDFTQNAQMQDGRFQVKLPAGSYSVLASTTNEVWQSASPIVIASDSREVHVVLAPPISIPVTVVKELSGGTAEQGGTPAVQSNPAMSLVLVSTSPSPNQVASWWRPQLGDIPNVQPGVYEVEINTASPWRVKSANCGGVDLLNGDLTVMDGAQPPPIEVTLSDDAATVGGGVAEAEDGPATVLLVQPRGSHNTIKMLTTSQGKFQFGGIAPGDYAIMAFGGVTKLEYANPEVLNPYLSSAVHLRVQPHGTISVNLNLFQVHR
jgi:Carboxypeptidase regulatory-like domain